MTTILSPVHKEEFLDKLYSLIRLTMFDRIPSEQRQAIHEHISFHKYDSRNVDIQVSFNSDPATLSTTVTFVFSLNALQKIGIIQQ